MNSTEKKALLNYIEFHLISMIEHVNKDVNGLAKAKLYNHAYEIMQDLDLTLEDITDTSAARA